jgi:hypothetical protein
MAALGAGEALTAEPTGGPIQLHCDLEADPAREQEMVHAFYNTFEPVIRKQPGFVAVKLLKLRGALAGSAPANAPYRLVISFETEQQRLGWVATGDHQRVWPSIEKTLCGAKYNAMLYDEAV